MDKMALGHADPVYQKFIEEVVYPSRPVSNWRSATRWSPARTSGIPEAGPPTKADLLVRRSVNGRRQARGRFPSGPPAE